MGSGLHARGPGGRVEAVPYDLRHTFVSLLIHEGRSVPYVAAMAGHPPRVCLERYATPSPKPSSAPALPMVEAINSARAEPGVYPECNGARSQGHRLMPENTMTKRMEDTGLEPVTSTLPA